MPEDGFSQAVMLNAVNHVQVMVALLQEGRKEELARYAAGIKRNL
ncbi:MAG: hypothetical protein AB1426_07980 [Bacillota bacterium]